ncbi:MAG: hypothetical protein JWR51_1496 [Devosia sp.]|nr:hypothetical protein [Devosia sp.]
MPPLSRPILFGALLLSALSHPALAADLISSNDWPMADAQAQIVGMIGTGRVYDLTIDHDSITLSVDHAIDPRQLSQYVWDASGVRPTMDIPNTFRLGVSDTEPFALNDLDFAAVPAVKAAALAAFNAQGAAITEIEATRPTVGDSKVTVALWTVHINDIQGNSGEVLVTTQGDVLHTTLP